jgi:hypothetical protein
LGGSPPATAEEPACHASLSTPSTTPAESRETLEALGKRFGGVLNIFGEMAHAPAVIDTYTAMERTLKDGRRSASPSARRSTSRSRT